MNERGAPRRGAAYHTDPVGPPRAPERLAEIRPTQSIRAAVRVEGCAGRPGRGLRGRACAPCARGADERRRDEASASLPAALHRGPPARRSWPRRLASRPLLWPSHRRVLRFRAVRLRRAPALPAAFASSIAAWCLARKLLARRRRRGAARRTGVTGGGRRRTSAPRAGARRARNHTKPPTRAPRRAASRGSCALVSGPRARRGRPTCSTSPRARASPESTRDAFAVGTSDAKRNRPLGRRHRHRVAAHAGAPARARRLPDLPP